MIKNSSVISKLIIISELLSTQSLIVPIKILFLLSFLITNSELSVLKLLFVASTFIFEVPTGYFADKYGNKYTVILSKLLSIISLILFCVFTNFIGFIVVNILLGLAAALESGAQNTYFLEISSDTKIDYLNIKIKVQKYNKIMDFLLMLGSVLAYSSGKFVPFLVTATLYLIALIIIIILPNHKTLKNQKHSSIIFQSKKIISQILFNKNLMIELIFYTISTSILISNFDYYTVFFKRINLDSKFFGIIFASFMLINMLGIQIYSKKIEKKNENIFFLMVPISFMLINIHNIFCLFLGIFIQQLTFSYFSIHFDIYVLKSINNLEDSSQYQSMISFINASLRMVILGLITIILTIVDIQIMYIIFAVILFGTILGYIKHQKINSSTYLKKEIVE